MDKSEQITSGSAKIINIILLESRFKRVPKVTFDLDKINNEISVNVDVQIREDMVYVTEEVKYQQKNNDLPSETEVDITIRYLGVFEISPEISEEVKGHFGRVNGGAMLFPYIREHIAGLSQKASINAIILPPFDFTNFEQPEKKVETIENCNL